MSFQPFIVTAELPPDILRWADALRRAYYPPERNRLAAHVTLFHSLAPSLHRELPTVLARMSAECATPAAEIVGLMNLGGGTALAISSPAMLALRDELANTFHGVMTAQDLHPPKLHITIQNKVAPAMARDLQSNMEAGFVPRRFSFMGFGLHRYCNPHWETVGVWPFRGKVSG